MAQTHPANEYDPDAEGIPDLEAPPPRQGPTGDLQDALILPADEPGGGTPGATVEEHRQGEPLRARLAREEPDVLDQVADAVDEPIDDETAERHAARRLVGTDTDVGAPDDEKDEVAIEVDD